MEIRKVYLRAMEPEDLDFLYEIENNERIWDISATNVPYSHYVLRNYIANAKNDFFADNQVRLIIENNAKQNIGILDLVNYDPQHQRAELGIVLLEEYQGKGYAYAAILRLIDYAQKNFQLHQIYAYVDVNNTKSYKCLKSVGFQENACLKDWFFKANKYNDAYVMQFFL